MKATCAECGEAFDYVPLGDSLPGLCSVHCDAAAARRGPLAAHAASIYERALVTTFALTREFPDPLGQAALARACIEAAEVFDRELRPDPEREQLLADAAALRAQLEDS